MSLTLTFFALDADNNERVIRKTVVPAEALHVYTSAPEIALRAAQTGGGVKPNGYRLTDAAGRVKASFSEGRRTD